MTTGKRFGVFIIAYNAERHIDSTISRIPSEIWDAAESVYVFDDCSTDDTVGAVSRLRQRFPKLKLIRNPVNRRYGGNQKAGYQHALDIGLDAVAMLHGDGQYAPEMLPEMLKPILEGKADIVLGSRMIARGNAIKGGMPYYKFLGNIILTRLQNALSGMALAEFHTGYRAYSANFLRSVPFWENTDEWHFDTEILLQAKISGASVVEIPVPTHYGDEVCHVDGLVYGMNCVVTAAKFALHKKGILYSPTFDVAVNGSKYHSKFEDPHSSHSIIFEHLSKLGLKGKKILELGVGDGSMTGRFADAGAIVDCVELAEASALLSRPKARHVWAEDLSQFDFSSIDTDYDIVVAADILEHLSEPERILAKIKGNLCKGGLLVVSLPNFANVHTRLALLFGRFEYQRKGILDRGHIKFFTLNSARRMLSKTGWAVESQDVTTLPLAILFPFLGKSPFRIVFSAIRLFTLAFRRLFGYQFVFFCRNSNSPGDLRGWIDSESILRPPQ